MKNLDLINKPTDLSSFDGDEYSNFNWWGIFDFMKKKNVSSRATTDQFDSFQKQVNDMGSDMFEGATAQQLASMKNKFISNLSKQEADNMIRITSKHERDWSDSDKSSFQKLISKWYGKKISS